MDNSAPGTTRPGHLGPWTTQPPRQLGPRTSRPQDISAPRHLDPPDNLAPIKLRVITKSEEGDITLLSQMFPVTSKQFKKAGMGLTAVAK